MPSWSPSQYLKFEEERTRPAAELLARISVAAPQKVVDVGCGPGNSTELLVRRWPQASVAGFDTSDDMRRAAAARLPTCRFFKADAATWLPTDEDIVFANAVFQWVSGHVAAIAAVFGAMRPGAVLAVQMPDNFNEPVHEAMRAAASEGPWSKTLQDLSTREGVAPAGAYYDALARQARRLDLWHTHYHHVVADAGAIVEWMKATGLRPYLDRLPGAAADEFLDAYRRRLESAYPPRANGATIFTAPRFFLVADRA
ncbi:MAG: trans-aconitate 2-methyltransferase [Bauldia sp.]